MITRSFTIKELHNLELRFAESVLANPNIWEGMRIPTMFERDQLLSSLQNELTHLTIEKLSGTGIKGNVIVDFGNTSMELSINWIVS